MSAHEAARPPRLRVHALLLLLFLMAGAASFLLRSRATPLGWGGVLDAAGTVCWAGVLTVAVSLLLRGTRRWSPWTWGIAVVVSLGVEFLQVTPYPAAWQAVFPPAHLVFGSTFSWVDIPWYLVGVLLAWWLLRRCGAPACRSPRCLRREE